MSPVLRRFILIFGVICISSSPIWVRFSDVPSSVLVFYRMLITCIILSPVVLTKSRHAFKEVKKTSLLLCLLSGCAFGLHLFTCFQGAKFTDIASCSTLGSTEVFFVAILSFVILREKISKKAFIGIVLAFAGGAIVTMADSSGSSFNLVGDAYALSSAVFVAFFTFIGRIVRSRGVPTMVYSFIVYATVAVIFLFVNLFSGIELIHINPVNFICALGMAISCTLLGHTIMSWALKYEQASFISTLKLSGPVYSCIMGVIFFMEVPGLVSLIGCLFIIAGIYCFLRANRPAEKESAAAAK